MFIRIKKVKNKKYAYLVGNRWYKRKKSSRQKVKGYLGPIKELALKKDTDFFEFIKTKQENINKYLEKNTKAKIIKDLVKWELFKHDADYKTFLENKSNVVYHLNDGFLCNYTINRILNTKPKDDHEQLGYELAKYFVEAGIKVPKLIFIGFFGKIV